MADAIQIEDVRSLGQYSSTAKWAVDITPAKGSSYATLSALKLNIRAITAKIPLKVVSADLEVKIRGFNVTQAGEDMWDQEFNCTAIETEDNGIRNFVRESRELKHNTKNGEMAKKSDSEFVIVLTQFDNSNKPIYEYKMIGARFNDAAGTDYSETATPDIWTLNFKYDYCEEKAI